MHLSHTDQLACNKQLQKEREYHGLHAADKMEDILSFMYIPAVMFMAR